MSGVPQQGTETRQSILPSNAPSGLGILGSPYSPVDSLLTPPQIGVQEGDSLSDVMNAVKGVAFYTDTIGFGSSSTSFTQGMPLKPLGINYFLKTGQQCSNGADMYSYFQGIPQGNALGSKIAGAMQQMGLPPLKGLAPGMLEDAEAALNPTPLLGALFGTGYPQCKQVTLQVGDLYGRIQADDGTQWIDSPETAVRHSDGLYYQTRWIQDTDAAGNPINLTKEQWNAAQKTMNADGTPISGSKEGFVGGIQLDSPLVIGGLALIVLVGFGLSAARR